MLNIFFLFYNYLECLSYSLLTSGKGKTTYDTPPGKESCDNDLSAGWFRFQGDAGTKMPTKCEPYKKCGTDYTGLLDSYHPRVADGKVRRTVCFRDRTDCCKHPFYIKVRNFGYFYVYQLTSHPATNAIVALTDNYARINHSKV